MKRIAALIALLSLMCLAFALCSPLSSASSIVSPDGWEVVRVFGGQDISVVWGSSPSDVFAVWAGGTILHYDGTSWTSMDSDTTMILFAVWGSSASDVFATTYVRGSLWDPECDCQEDIIDAVILHYDGTGWSQAYHETEWDSWDIDWYYGLWGSSSGDVFAVGYQGKILHYDGTTWTAMSSGTTNDLYGVWGSSPSDVFAVGYQGKILHYDGTTWKSMTSGTTQSLNSVWGSSASDVFAVGSDGAVLHYDGMTWSAMTSGTRRALQGIWGSSSSDVFAVGAGGTILHYDGTTWTSMNSGTSDWLRGVWGSSSSDVFAVGARGTILHRGFAEATSIYPSQGSQGETLDETITGHDLAGAAAVTFGDGITVNTFTVDSSTRITCSITIAADADPGARNVSVTTPGGVASLPNAFTVMQAPPTVTSIDPTEGKQGERLAATITGAYLMGAQALDLGDGISVDNCTGDSSTQITCNLTIAADADPGARNVSVTTPGGVATLPNAFAVMQAPPTIASIDPRAAQAGTLPVTITGTCLTGTQTLDFGDGITVDSFTVDSSTQITCNITIAADAEAGIRDVSIVTPSGTSTLPGGFEVVGPGTGSSDGPSRTPAWFWPCAGIAGGALLVAAPALYAWWRGRRIPA